MEIHNVVRSTSLHGSSDLRVGKKNGELLIALSVQGKDGSATGSDPENRVGVQDIGSPSRPVSPWLQVPGDPGHYRANTSPLDKLPAVGVFS
jgi:hypothetical protein